MKFFLVLTTLFFVFGAQAAFEAEVNDQTLSLENPRYIRQSLVQANLSSTQDVKFGENTMKSVPKGTEIKTLKNEQGELYIYFMTFRENLPVQKWKVFGGVEVSLNCSPESGKLRFVSFYKNHQIDMRCNLVDDQKIPAGEKDQVEVLSGSYISFLESGKLKHASSSKGVVLVEGQKLPLKLGKDIAYFQNESIQFFNLKKGETFTLKDSALKDAVFGQPLEGVQVATVFYENGKLDQGYLFSDLLNPKKIKVLGEEVNLSLSEGPVGFSKEGFLDRVVLKKEINVVVKEATSIYLEDRQNQDAFSLTLKPGDPFSVVAGTPLSFSRDKNELVLESFPVQIKGQVYILTILKP